MKGRYKRKSFGELLFKRLILPFAVAFTAHCAIYWTFTEYKTPFFRVNDFDSFRVIMDLFEDTSDEFERGRAEDVFGFYYPGYDFGHSGIEQTAVIWDADTNEILASDDFTLPSNKTLKKYLEDPAECAEKMNEIDQKTSSGFNNFSTVFFYERYDQSDAPDSTELSYSYEYSEKKTISGYETCHLSSEITSGSRKIRVFIQTKINYYSYFFKYLFPADVIMFAAALTVSLLLTFQKNSENIREEYRRSVINSLSHDLKTPLTIISGCAENLRENVDPEKREFYENAIIENAKYTESIIDDALQLTRSEKDIARPERSRFEISPIVSELWKKYEFSASERGLILSVSGDAKIKADRKMITQLLENLISNAVKYADPDTAIDIRFSSNLIAVSNEFSGKITTDINRLTEPFVRGTGERSGRNGSGVGLAIVKNIADIHKYKVRTELKDERFTVKIKI